VLNENAIVDVLTRSNPELKLCRVKAAPVAAFFVDGVAFTSPVSRPLLFVRHLVRKSQEFPMFASAQLQAIICTSRVGQAERFYSDVLMLPLKARSLGALVYDVGGTVLRVSPVPSSRPSEHTVLGFAVANIDRIVTELQERGVPLERFPAFPHDQLGVVRAPDGSKVAWFRDPDGNLLSAVQYPES